MAKSTRPYEANNDYSVGFQSQTYAECSIRADASILSQHIGLELHRALLDQVYRKDTSMIRTLIALLLLISAIATSQDRPTADAVIDNYVKALGGEKAISKFSTRVRKGTTEIVGMQGEGEIEEYYKSPNKMMIKLTLPVVGTIQYGYDGTNGWRRDPASGLIDVSDKELADLVFESMFNAEARPRERYKKFELQGTEKVNGRDAFLVISTPANLPAEKLYFDAQSGLLVRQVVTRPTQTGEVTDEVLLDDYREVDGVKVPFLERHTSLGITYLVKIREVKNNVPVDNSLFSKPKLN